VEISISQEKIERLKRWSEGLKWQDLVLYIAIFLSTLAIATSLFFGWIINYGDAQSHLNISKRVVDSITPGMAQLGGIWLPIPIFSWCHLSKSRYSTGRGSLDLSSQAQHLLFPASILIASTFCHKKLFGVFF